MRTTIKNKPSFTAIKKISVLLVDDHSIVREGIRALLKAEGDIEVVGEADTGRKALEMAVRLRPAVILMDIAMPSLNGLEATRQLRTIVPDSKVIILSAHSDDAYVTQVIAFGARGFLIKQASFQILSQAIREVNDGKMFFSPSIVSHFQNHDLKTRNQDAELNTKLMPLSPREAEVLQMIAEGQANKQIAAALAISIKTVEKHRQHLMEKLKIHDTAGLTRYAIGAGIIESRTQSTIL